VSAAAYLVELCCISLLLNKKKYTTVNERNILSYDLNRILCVSEK
jgi:hypothetical protein